MFAPASSRSRAGDNDGAHRRRAARARRSFPSYSEANRVLARVSLRAARSGSTCLDAARRVGAESCRIPEVLGYEADAQRALGDAAGAAQTDDLIRTIERIGNAQHVSDRLLAIYYSEHREPRRRVPHREGASSRCATTSSPRIPWRGPPRWTGAGPRRAARSGKALRYGTENALLQYHARHHRAARRRPGAGQTARLRRRSR